MDRQQQVDRTGAKRSVGAKCVVHATPKTVDHHRSVLHLAHRRAMDEYKFAAAMIRPTVSKGRDS